MRRSLLAFVAICILSVVGSAWGLSFGSEGNLNSARFRVVRGTLGSSGWCTLAAAGASDTLNAATNTKGVDFKITSGLSGQFLVEFFHDDLTRRASGDNGPNPDSVMIAPYDNKTFYYQGNLLRVIMSPPASGTGQVYRSMGVR